MTEEAQILDLIEQRPFLRPRELASHGISREALSRMVRKGRLQRSSRGIYLLPDDDRITEHHSYAEAVKGVPQGVVCLLSALRFHDLTTQMPHEIWLALPHKAWRPRKQWPPLRYIWLQPAAMRLGVERHDLEGVEVPVFNIPRTIVDCFLYRNKLGLDVALEALREAIRERRCKPDDIYTFAIRRRAWNTIRPYLEALV